MRCIWWGSDHAALAVAQRGPDPQCVGTEVDAESSFTSFRRGLLTNLLNPKIGVFYMAVLPQFIPVSTPRP